MQSSNVASIQTATYMATVLAKKGSAETAVTKSDSISRIVLEGEVEYSIMITAGGNGKSGYCVIEFGETVYFTPKVKPNETFTFQVKACCDGELKITPQWGTYSSSEKNVISSETMLELSTHSANNGVK